MPRRSPPSRAARRPSPLRGPVAAGPAVAGPGRVIAARAAEGSDEHYAQLAVGGHRQPVRTAIKLEPAPDPHPGHSRRPSITKNTDEHFTCWRIKLPHAQAATLDAAINAHREAPDHRLEQAHDGRRCHPQAAPPMPGDLEAFPAPGRGRLGRRSHPPPARCASTTVVVHSTDNSAPPCTWGRCCPTTSAAF